jgi:hypothetical protein
VPILDLAAHVTVELLEMLCPFLEIRGIDSSNCDLKRLVQDFNQLCECVYITIPVSAFQVVQNSIARVLCVPNNQEYKLNFTEVSALQQIWNQL